MKRLLKTLCVAATLTLVSASANDGYEDNSILISAEEAIKLIGDPKVMFVTGDNEDVCISVIDHGDGIDPDYLPYIFDELSDPDVAHHSEGHGLSLAIARQVILRQGGNISAESTKGSGTIFRIQLPVMVPSDLVNCER